MKVVLDYYKPENFFINNIAYDTHKVSFNRLLETFNISEDLKDQITGNIIENEEQTACSLIFGKSQQTVISILLLCNEGNRNDAGTLLRSLYENFIQMKYIIKHKRGIEFLNYLWVAYKRYIESDFFKTFAHESLNNEQIDQIVTFINKQYNQIKDDYLTSKSKIRDKWSKENLKEMAVDIGESISYDFIMKIFSTDVHCDIFGIKDIMIPENKKTIFDNSPKIEGLEIILDMAYEFFGRIVTELVLLYGTNIPCQLKKFIIEK